MENIISVFNTDVLKSFISYVVERESYALTEKYNHYAHSFSASSATSGIIDPAERLRKLYACFTQRYAPDEVIKAIREEYDIEKDFESGGLSIYKSLKIFEKALFELVTNYTTSPEETIELQRSIFYLFNELDLAFTTKATSFITKVNEERKLAENLFRNSIDGILVYDNDLIIREFNPALEVLTGLNKEEVIGKKVEIVMPHLLDSGEIRFYQQVLKGLSLMVPEVNYTIPTSGKKGYYNSSYTPVLNINGIISGGLVVFHEITRRKKIEEKLRQQKQFSENLINNSIDGVFAFNKSFKCTAWNPQMELVTGIMKAKALGNSVQGMIYDSADFQTTSLSKVLDGEIIYLEEFQFPSNTQKFEVFIMPVYNPDKSITGGLVIVHNITERTKAEEALRELSESLKHTVEGIALVNTEGKFISANKAIGKLVDLTTTELQNKCWKDLLAPEDLELANRAFEQVRTENSASFESRLQTKELTGIYVEITVVPYQDKFGALKGYHLFFRDITERKLVENRLKRSEALLIEAQELARLGSFEYDPVESKMVWSDEVFRIFGLKPKEIKPDLDAFYSLLSEDAREIMTSTWNKVMATYKPSNFEHKVKVPGKLTRVVYGHAKPVINNQGKIVKITGYIQDITERKEAEKILKEAYEELKQAEENLVKINTRLENRVRQRTQELSSKNEELRIKNEELLKINSDLDNFVYTASHDLKSPISNIEGLINTLSDELKNSHIVEYDYLIEMINISINKFKTTIKDLTEITKIQKDMGEDITRISIEELIEEVRYDIKHLMDQEGVDFQTSLRLPHVRFSRKNLRSILYNLISNAIKYRSGERAPIVIVSSEQREDYALIRVRDNGLGLELQQKDKIFRMFKRMHTHVEGTGIGLYIVKRIIENSGGKIEVDSEVGKGTEFRVFLKTQD